MLFLRLIELSSQKLCNQMMRSINKSLFKDLVRHGKIDFPVVLSHYARNVAIAVDVIPSCLDRDLPSDRSPGNFKKVPLSRLEQGLKKIQDKTCSRVTVTIGGVTKFYLIPVSLDTINAIDKQHQTRK